MNSNTSTDAPRSESGRVPSPSSVSSVHSIRPLEWDSGADIGYQYKMQSGLSTVERIALVSGTVSLLESCAPQENTGHSYLRKHNLGHPLAQSSPFIIDRRQLGEQRSPVAREAIAKCPMPLVDYSISSEHSMEDKTDLAESVTPSKAYVKSSDCSKLRGDSQPRAAESSRSLDDLRSLKHLRRSCKVSARSRSSQNIFDSLHKSSCDKNSSSSIATIVPPSGGSSVFINQPVRRCSSKGVQVDAVSLREFCEDEQPRAAPMSSLEFFRKMYCENANSPESNTCSVKNGDRYERTLNLKKVSVSEDCQSAESLGGSFEYVPGSVYDSRKMDSKRTSNTTSKDSSSVNTLCSEVVEGVELVTRYVENLRVSNKRQIIEKMAKSLIRSSIGRSRENSTQPRAASHLLLDSSPELRSKTPPYERLAASEASTGSDFPSSNLGNGSGVSRASCVASRSSTDNSRFPPSTSDAFKSSRGSRRQSTSVNSVANACISDGLNFSESSMPAETTSSYGTDGGSLLKPAHSNKLNAKCFSLREYLAKERDAQLLWIKSGIDHLNNLKKLYESQKRLRNDLDSLKKASSIETADRALSGRTTSGLRCCRGARKALTRSANMTHSKAFSSDPIELATSTSNSVLGGSRTADALKSSAAARRHLRRERKYDVIGEVDVARYERNYKRRAADVENKENISANSCATNVGATLSKASAKWTTAGSKPPISYTVVFDKGPVFGAGSNFEIKEHKVQKLTSQIIQTSRKRIRKTTSTTELRCTSNNASQSTTLQEHLLRNKPDYVDRAEYRRQCLAEIAKLRELRDKSREELFSMMKNLDQTTDCIPSSNVPPPPLSVLRIFSDRSMKRQTQKKYQQLPEVQSKKLELKRMESYRRNQIMAKVFTKRLQKKVLRGQVNLANNVNVISA